MLRVEDDALSGESSRRLLIWRWLVVPIAIVALAGAFYFFATTRSNRVSGGALAPTRVALTADQRRLSDDVGEAEREYGKRLAQHAAADELAVVLGRAIGQQQELLRQNPLAGVEQDVRLERLKIARDSERAKAATPRVISLQAEAEQANRAGQIERAVERWREALALQREIDASDAEGHWKDFAREMELVQALETAEAAPVHAGLADALRRAGEAVDAGRWKEALAEFTSAREAQLKLNHDFARTKFADLRAVDRIEEEISSLHAADSAALIDAHEQAGDAAAERGRIDEAAERYRLAIQTQQMLNREFARSRFVSTPRIEAIDLKRQTVLAAEMLTAISTLDRAIAAALLKRHVLVADKKIGDALELLALVERDHPKAQNFDAELKLKLSYLGSRRPELRALQDALFDRLTPVPGARDLLMLRTELPQEIYQRVMSTNPSRHAGRGLPVDSVNWMDAQEFCRRAGWLLGAPVRLPALEDFRAALGDGPREIWSVERSQGHSREVAAGDVSETGFADLLGNVAEWLNATGESDSGAVVVAGGSYMDAAAALGDLPTTLVNRNDRARHIGFRIVVTFPME